MWHPVAFAPGCEQSLHSPVFFKLGNYFDRPEWWEEGAATLDAFFDEIEPPLNELDQRLEDLLDLLEPLKVVEEPHRSNSAVDATVQRDDHVGVAPAVENNIQESLPLPDNRILVESLSAVDVNTVNDTIDTSFPVLTSTTIITRQTSPRPKSSTRATSVPPDAGSSLEDGALEPSPFEAPKHRSSLDSTTTYHRDALASVTTGGDDNVALTDPLAAIQNDPISIPLARPQDPISDEHANCTETPRSGLEDDPTGLQAVKDEVSDEYGLTTAIDSSSILTQESDITVVHDPSSAAVSFFPPNPYSDEPHEFNFDTSENFPVIFDRQDGGVDHEDKEDLSADSTLTSLASDTAQLPEDYLEQLNDLERWRFKTPSPPPSSPLSPPSPSWFATRHVDKDATAGADSGYGGDATPSTIPPTPVEPTAELRQARRPTRSRNTKGLRIITTKVTDGLAQSTGTEDTKMPAASTTTRKVKRKQEESHPEIPSQKRSLRSRPRGEEQSTSDAESILSPEAESIRDKIERAQRGKGKAVSKSTQRNSPDELAPVSPDELAALSASNPFDLNKDPLSLAKSKPNRSTVTRSRARKPVDTSAPLRKLVGVARATRAAVSNKELAGLLGASPPRRAEEKAEVDIGGRLRSQALTPAPTPAPAPNPVPMLAPSSTPEPTTEITDIVTTEAPDTDNTDKPPRSRRKRLPGANPLGALELKELGSHPILESRTRARTATVEPTPEPAAVLFTKKPASMRTRTNVKLAAPDPVDADDNQDMEVNPTHVPPLDLTTASEHVSTTQDTDIIAAETSDTNNTDAPSPTKRKRLTGTNPLGALELKELGSFPVLESRTRSRTATVEPTPEPAAAQPTVKPTSKRSGSNLNTTAPNTTEAAETDSAVGPAPDPTPKPTPAKRIRKSVVRTAAKPAASSPFALTAKSKGTPAASRKKAPAKQKAVKVDKDIETPPATSITTSTKRKRGEDGEESEKGATRVSKRIAGAEPKAEQQARGDG